MFGQQCNKTSNTVVVNFSDKNNIYVIHLRLSKLFISINKSLAHSESWVNDKENIQNQTGMFIVFWQIVLLAFEKIIMC